MRTFRQGVARRCTHTVLLPSLVVLSSVAPGAAKNPAFPGAQGGGAGSVGGRGGYVMEVTNLQDSGAGSFRACIEARGPRTCVFRVAGVINVLSRMQVSNPFLTVAGQTAPGHGITLSGKQISSSAVAILFISTHNVVIRYLTVRVGLGRSHTAGPSTGMCAFEVANGDNYNIILDHVTASWWDNKGLVLYSGTTGPNRRITTQWSLFYEPHAGHPVGPSVSSNPTEGQGVSNLETDVDFHHNVFCNTGHRLPQLWNKSTRWVNNIVYNWDYYASQLLGSINADFIGNRYKAGPLNRDAQVHEIEASPEGDYENSGPPSIYLLGNIGPNQPNPAWEQWLIAAQVKGENGKEIGPIPPAWRRAVPLPVEQFPIIADDARNLDDILLPTVGNSRRLDCSGNWVSTRDVVDVRVISEYRGGTSGGFFTMEDANHKIPVIDPDSACQDSDHDGIPDSWEVAHGLNPKNPSDAQKLNSDGYTNLEHYLNGTASGTQSAKTLSSTEIAKSNGRTGRSTINRSNPSPHSD